MCHLSTSLRQVYCPFISILITIYHCILIILFANGWFMLRSFLGLLLATTCWLQSFPLNQVFRHKLPPVIDLLRVELKVWSSLQYPRGVIVLAPGWNGDGEYLVRQKEWQKFAHKNKLALVGLSFASANEPREEKLGYYYVPQGSGEALLQGITQIFGQSELPLLMYGFSGGAHFTSRFEEWKPERVLTWCAYSAGWWDRPQTSQVSPPGLVICGDGDERYGASLIYFKQGRALGKPWLWISVPRNGHNPHPEAEDFVRDYFQVILDGKARDATKGGWIDIDRQAITNVEEVSAQPSVTAWLPDMKLLQRWITLHEP
jgi:hypothetical protein